MIRVDDLTYTYPSASQAALSGLTLEVPRGQLCGVVGANGSGKSTLCYALAAIVPQLLGGTASGRVQIGELEVLHTAPSELAGVVGLVFDNPFNQITGARFTVREEIAFGLENLGIPRGEMGGRISEVLKLTGLSELADRSPFSLSGGQQQRLAVASILALQPALLVLDEPTSQLDPTGTAQLFQALAELTREAEITVLLVEQKIEHLARFADRVVVLGDGRVIADGEPEQILGSSDAENWGIEQTKFTQAAIEAGRQGLVARTGALPVTLEQAKQYFQ